MDQVELTARAEQWIKYWQAPQGSPERLALWDAVDLYDLEYDDPETLWLLILEIHRMDHSTTIQQVLSAGPIENLLRLHGENFIGRIEDQARKDPKFAQVLGGVWEASMGDAVWKRLQAVWDRRGWDGVQE